MVLKRGYLIICTTNPKFVTVTALENNVKLKQVPFALLPFNAESSDDVETQFTVESLAHLCHKTEICNSYLSPGKWCGADTILFLHHIFITKALKMILKRGQLLLSTTHSKLLLTSI